MFAMLLQALAFGLTYLQVLNTRISYLHNTLATANLTAAEQCVLSGELARAMEIRYWHLETM
tara:strand:+ start:2950 stop:3135 length:186 start_codon:yes stop_codon:yes gene_type:complete